MIALGYKTALEVWRQWPEYESVPATSRISSLSNSSSSEEAVAAALPHYLQSLSRPLHLLVDTPEKRRRSNTVKTHLMVQSPTHGSLARISNLCYISTPTLLFLQLTRELPLPKLLLVGCELCGTFTPDPDSIYGIRNRLPLSSTQTIEAFLARTSDAAGLKKARRYAQYLMNGSASPRESALALLLSLPRLLGGYALPKPLLNYRITLPSALANTQHISHFRCDLCWPDKKFAIEYDSNIVHSGADKIRRDSHRRAVLEYLGYTVATVTGTQIQNFDELDVVARLAAKSLGVRTKPITSEWLQTHHELKDGLLR